MARLREVRSLEETRRQHGLSAGYIAEPEAERRAIERLVQLAGRRPRGLIARAEQAPEAGGSMTVRLTAAPFAPASDDAPLYLLAPTSLPSSALATNVEAVALQGAKLRPVHDVAEIPHDEPALVLNWGGLGDLRSRHVVLNRPEAVRVSSDQLESLRALRELAPRTVLNPQDLHLLGGDQVVAKRRHGSRGSGKRVVAASESVQELARFDLYQEFGRQRREYRVSVLSGRVVSAYRKRAPEGSAPEDLAPDWTYEPSSHLRAAVVDTARRAAERIGLDYAGVDVIEDLRTGRVLCLETNAAPGMSEGTLRSLYATVQQMVREGG